MNFDLKFKNYKNSFEEFLLKYINHLNSLDYKLMEAIKYSLFSGGKRIRPIIMLASYELCGGKSIDIYKFAASLEMVHTYSLIHDDLPCMDDDKFRRGKPCNHMVYGEDTALLAGDALLTLAFEIISTGPFADFDLNDILKSVAVFSSAAGCNGMILGQFFDLNISKNNLDAEKLLNIYNLKTANLFSSATEIGAILAKASHEKINALKSYGKNIGLCFQLVDDILDGEKSNISIFKNPTATEMLKNLTLSAKKDLKIFENDASFLGEFADFLASRVN